jgi:site-specific recombinase XerC
MSWQHGRGRWAWVRLRDGSRVRRSLGASDKGTAREIEKMLETLHARREWQLIEAATFGPSNIGELFDYWRRGDEGLDELRAKLGDVDLAQYVEAWARWAERRASKRTVEGYRKQLRVLILEGARFPRSAFTRRHISDALAKLTCSGSTARRYLAAWSSFGSYLVEQELLDANPIRSVKAPRNNAPREVWLPLEDVLRLVDAQREPFRALAALREGAGVEISAALRVRRRDVELRRAIVQVTGTKNVWRTRPVLLDEWAKKRLASYIAARRFTPDALLFEGVTERQAWGVQKEAVAALKLQPGYRLHDARHSYAVRQMKAGVDPQVIANNLGHKDTTMLWKVYGKYRPTMHDLARERMRAVP